MTSNLNCLTCGQPTLVRLRDHAPHNQHYDIGCTTCKDVHRLNDYIRVAAHKHSGAVYLEADTSQLDPLYKLPCPHCGGETSLWLDDRAICTKCSKSYTLLDQVFNIQEPKDVTGVQT